MDFYQICTRPGKNGMVEIYPDFTVGRSKDLMVRGRGFYAIWDETKGMWSTDEYDVQRIVDEELRLYSEDLNDEETVVRYLKSFNTNGWNQFRRFMSNVSDNSHQLDERLTFANTVVKKADHVSRRLPYDLAPGEFRAWDELIGSLYSEEERQKIEWSIGAVVSGDSKNIQKFLVFYGPAGSGKSTILNIIQQMFDGYVTSFEAKSLGSLNGSFATEVFKDNPLVAINHDGDLSKIDDNTKLNSIISHEFMTMNEKYKPSYTARVNAFLFMGTNQPVKISDAKSGIIRRLIDVQPTGHRIPVNHYNTLMSQIEFELGAIANHCLEVYSSLGKNFYNGYRPLEMMLQTDIFFNFIEAHYDVFKGQDNTTLKQAYILYKEYCADTGIERPLPQYKVREELRNYFDEFKERANIDGQDVRSVYIGFTASRFKSESKKDKAFSLVLDETYSLFDRLFAEQPAQYANARELPSHKWENVKTSLGELDTTLLHYVLIPENHIVIDFDLKGDDGGKSLERNLQAASLWPATYAELSKSGAGVHLHYIFEGDVSSLASNYSDGIEIKQFAGNSSLRRRRSRCNSFSIATINSGLPFKEKKMLPVNTIKSERGLRELVERNLKKEIHPGTKPSIDFIHKILQECYDSGMTYDLTDLRPKIIAFANNSTNQPLPSLKMVQSMKFKSEEVDISETDSVVRNTKDDRLVFFDCEVYPNLFAICWKYENDSTVVKMLNPTPKEVEALLGMRLVGYNCRKYDNHILYARVMGYNNEQLYRLSQKIIDGNIGAMFGEAYNLSYADIYDFTSKKQSLKKYQIELSIPHKEMNIPWDQDVPEDRWEEVLDYCSNDVVSSEAVFHARSQDFTARRILAELSGLAVNDTTQKHTARIIFGNDRKAQEKFVYTDLSETFPGYKFELGKSTYRDEDPSEGGYVYAEPGIYKDVAVLDVASMHPTSIEQLTLFGPYTKNFAALKSARMAIKHKEYKTARSLLDGRLGKFLGSDDDSQALAYALKIVINIVYGLTSAKFENPFRDVRNVDNIVAKRGALFMIDLKHAVQEQGFTVAHIKTDSIKIPDATPEIIDFVMAFGEKYGYDFEHEVTYDRFCLVNDAVYIARSGDKWEAVGAQFQHPYVFKTLFSGEPIEFDDLCETKQVSKGAIYIDMVPDRPMVSVENMQFIGRVGRFVPVTQGGGVLYRVYDGKPYAVTGTKGYRWLEADMLANMDGFDGIDMAYFQELVDNAQAAIEKFGSVHDFIRDIFHM